MKRIYKWVCLLSAIAIGISMTACGDDDDEYEDEPSGTTESKLNAKQKSIYDQVVNTSWAIEKSVLYKNNGSDYNDYLALHPECLGQTITFSSEIAQYTGLFKLYCSAFPNDYVSWYPSDELDSDIMFKMSNDPNCSNSNSGLFFTVFGVGDMEMAINGDKLSLTRVGDAYIHEYVYRRSRTGGGTNGGGSSSDKYEEPDVSFYDYTPYGSSAVKVDFIIYNKDASGVTSAQIQYGTTSSATSSASSSIVGKHVIATISGLKANTDYYVKCKVKSKGGTVTTPATRIRL